MEFDWEKGEHPWLLVGHDDDGFFVVVNGCKITRRLEERFSESPTSKQGVCQGVIQEVISVGLTYCFQGGGPPVHRGTKV